MEDNQSDTDGSLELISAEVIQNSHTKQFKYFFKDELTAIKESDNEQSAFIDQESIISTSALK